MYSNNGGDNSSAFGYAALYSNTTGYENVAVGSNVYIATQQVDE